MALAWFAAVPRDVTSETGPAAIQLASTGASWKRCIGTHGGARVLDFFGAAVALIFLLPLMLLIACMIKIDSAGPVLYRQDRVGRHGTIFTLLKFRTMRQDAELDGPRWAAERDHRITRVGALLRASRLDEIPQFVNVLCGEMSLVGPRPERPYFSQQLAKVIPNYAERTRVLPGITGWAQINHPYGASVEDARTKLTYDLFYIANRGLLLNLRILVATVPVMLLGRGAR